MLSLLSRYALLTIVVFVLGAVAQNPDGAPQAASERPAWTKPLTASLADDSIQLFKDKNFSGTMVQVSEVTSKTPWQDHEFAGRSENKFSSMRWNLPRGVVVSVFENDNCLGRMIALWGSGEIASLNKSKLNDRLSCWTWNFVGGVRQPSQRILDGRAARPKYAKDTDLGALTMSSIHLFKDRECNGKEVAIERIANQPPGQFHEMPDAVGKGTSSLRWKLPHGMVVVFSEEASGEGRQLAIWGDGMFEACNQWDMNDRITHWAWYSVGEK